MFDLFCTQLPILYIYIYIYIEIYSWGRGGGVIKEGIILVISLATIQNCYGNLGEERDYYPVLL